MTAGADVDAPTGIAVADESVWVVAHRANRIERFLWLVTPGRRGDVLTRVALDPAPG